jgi:hypothetical protein
MPCTQRRNVLLTPSNYIADNTLAEVPPPYFLQRLYDQDAMLVVIPSRNVPAAYVIARRKQWGPGLTDAAIDSISTQPDTKMCVKYGCVPVCLMYKTGTSWNPDPIIRSLQARDMWAHGGPEKVADMLEAQEAAAKVKQQKETRDDMWNRSGDAWRSYQHRTGQTSIRSRGEIKLKPRKERRPKQTVPSGSTAGLGAAKSA